MEGSIHGIGYLPGGTEINHEILPPAFQFINACMCLFYICWRISIINLFFAIYLNMLRYEVKLLYHVAIEIHYV